MGSGSEAMIQNEIHKKEQLEEMPAQIDELIELNDQASERLTEINQLLVDIPAKLQVLFNETQEKLESSKSEIDNLNDKIAKTLELSNSIDTAIAKSNTRREKFKNGLYGAILGFIITIILSPIVESYNSNFKGSKDGNQTSMSDSYGTTIPEQGGDNKKVLSKMENIQKVNVTEKEVLVKDVAEKKIIEPQDSE
ncbi:hypothetical protein ACJ5M9_004987 [Vibrio campbellii]